MQRRETPADASFFYCRMKNRFQISRVRYPAAAPLRTPTVRIATYKRLIMGMKPISVVMYMEMRPMSAVTSIKAAISLRPNTLFLSRTLKT